jgi:hypothetical protein
MSLRLAVAQRWLPERTRLRMLDGLARITAEGFDAQLPDWAGNSFQIRLAQYASFTAREAGALVASGNEHAIEATRERLHSGAVALGEMTRRRLGLRCPDDAFAALRLLYHQIGIEMSGGPTGEMVVGRCFFADHYTQPICQLMAALDQGLVSGLFGGASLEFSERLTGGGRCCRALLQPARSEE